MSALGLKLICYITIENKLSCLVLNIYSYNVFTGVWLFHCHVDFHMALGMAAVVQVGETHEMRAAPGNFPRCGSWRYTEDSAQYSMCKLDANSVNGHVTNISLLLLLVGLSCWGL